MVGNSSAQDGHLDLTNKQSDFTINCDADAMNNGYRCVKIGDAADISKIAIFLGKMMAKIAIFS